MNSFFQNLATSQPCEVAAGAVRNTTELRRILSLPKRDAEVTGAALAQELTNMLKKHDGTMVLRPLQALAIAEAATLDGAVALLSVGLGKTVISYLAGTAAQAQRPLLLVPGKLLEKTHREFAQLALHWKGTAPAIVSYEKLSTDSRLLENHMPDMIIADEAHRLKNRKASCTRRLNRYFQQHACSFVALSGTLTNRSFMDWWHLQLWALPEELLVLPSNYKEAEQWAEALDVKAERRRPLGALSVFGADKDAARTGFGELLRCVPGVIAAKTDDLACSLSINVRYVQHSFTDTIGDALDKLTFDWTTPDGTEFDAAVELDRHAKELTMGFYYRWKEPPPAEWLAARTAVSQLVTRVLQHSRHLESPGDVLRAMADDPVVRAWRRAERTFRPLTEPVWLDDSVVNEAWQWAQKNDGLIWCSHFAFGAKLEENGIPFFHSNGCTSSWKHIYDHTGPAAVSVAAMSEGFNLQAWRKNLVPFPPSTGKAWEQLLGRTHRPGQEADEVECEVWLFSKWAAKNFKQSRLDAEYIQRITGQAQKLCLADMENGNGNEYV